MRSSMRPGPRPRLPRRQAREARLHILPHRLNMRQLVSDLGRGRLPISSQTTTVICSNLIRGSMARMPKEPSRLNHTLPVRHLSRARAPRAVPATQRLLRNTRQMLNPRKATLMSRRRLNSKAKATKEQPRVFFHRSSRCHLPCLLRLSSPCPK